MKHIKLFEDYQDFEDNKFVKCNWCGWYGKENELSEDNNNYQYCPNCNTDEHLMDISPFDDDFFEYMEENEPTPNINKKDYDNIEDYYKALYPYYFITKKFNI